MITPRMVQVLRYLQNLIKLPGLFLVFLKNSTFQKKFLLNTVKDILNESKKSNDKSLEEDDYKKIFLYGFAVPAMLGEAYCTLRGQKMTTQERLCITYLGAITGLFDDLFDKKELADCYIEDLMTNSHNATGNNTNEKLLLNFYNQALDNAENPDLIIQNALFVYNAQLLSKKQKQPNIEIEEIEHITFEKGGSSMLLYRSALKNRLGKNEERMIFKLGSLGQLENDIFDVYKDFKEGIKTLATTMKKTDHLRKKYLALMVEIFDLVEQTSYSLQSKKKFCRIISLIMCRGLVCLDFIEKNEKTTNRSFCVDKYNRNKLICNMESAKSYIKLIHYSAKYTI